MKSKGTRIKLDDIDRRILRDLQDNGRITNVELARRAGISAPPCLRRVRVLEDAGYNPRLITPDLEPKALVFNVMVFAQVGLEIQAEATSKPSRNWFTKGRRCASASCWPARPISCSRWWPRTGTTTRNFLTTKLTSAPNVSHVKSALPSASPSSRRACRSDRAAA